MKLKDMDKGMAALVKRAGLMGAQISVGIHAKEGDVQKEDTASPVTLLQVAEWMEFGTKNCPPRSFVRAWFDENEAQAKEALSRLARQVLGGKISKQQALERLGLYFVGQMQKRMADGIPPPLAESTIKAKGSDTPLIKTGQLRSGLTYQVS